MASTYSSNLKIELMSTGENSGTWGDITNTNLGTTLEQAVIGLGNPDFIADANLTITITNSSAAQPARALVLNVTSVFGSLTATRELIVPTIQKQYIVQNNTTGGQSITVKTSAGTGITVPNGRKAHLYVDGTNVIQMFDFVDINGGAIDGTTIGASSASTGAFTTLNASGATTLDGNVTLGNASGDTVTVTGTIASNLLFTDNTYDIGASGATRPRNLFLAGAATIGGNLSVGGTLTLTGGVNLNGNVVVGDTSADTLTINATITSNLLFTDNTYDIGASGATRPRNLFLAGNATIGGAQTLTGALTVDSTTDTSSATTGSIQTDGGVGIAKALFVGTTVTLDGGTANGVAFLNGSKVLTTGSALTFDGTNLTLANSSGVTSNLTTNQAAGSVGSPLNLDLNFKGYLNTINARIRSWDEASSTGYGYLTFWTSDGTTLAERYRITQDGTAIWNVAGSEQMRLTSTGLGIGTSSPYLGLSVYKTSDATFTNLPANALFHDATAMAAGVGGGIWLGGRYLTGSTSTTTFAAISGIKENGTGGDVAGTMTFGVRDSGGGTTIERMRLNSSGNLGLGVTPSAFGGSYKGFQIGQGGLMSRTGGSDVYLLGNNYYDGTNFRYINTSFASRYQQDAGAHAWFTAPSGTAGDAISFTQAMTLDASGNLVVGATSTSYRLEVVAPSGDNVTALFRSGDATAANNAGGGFRSISSATAGDRRAQLWLDADGANFSGGDYFWIDKKGNSGEVNLIQQSNAAMLFSTNGTERARITSGGDLLVGRTSSANIGTAFGITLANTNFIQCERSAAPSLFLRRGDNGNISEFYHGTDTLVGSISVTATATAYNTSSDYRLKNITGPITTSGAYIDSLNPVEGTWKVDGSTFVGLIAHEVQEASRTQVATGVKDGEKMQGMDYSSAEIIANLIAEVKSLRQRLAAAGI